MEQALFAAGRFWGVQYYFDQIPGVTKTIAGYAGGVTENPTYEDVLSHTTGHAEAVWIEYYASKVSYETLVRHFFRLHNPTQLNRQGADEGENYRSVIFYITDDQREIAEHVKEELQPNFDGKIVTQIVEAGPFYQAESNHQKYVEKTGDGMGEVAYEPLAKA